jgi:hypothetical protein
VAGNFGTARSGRALFKFASQSSIRIEREILAILPANADSPVYQECKSFPRSSDACKAM